jgi:hypothetical protein
LYYLRSADWSRLIFLCHSASRNHAVGLAGYFGNFYHPRPKYAEAMSDALPIVLVVHDDELDYFTIHSCFFLVSYVAYLYTCIQ